MITTRLRYLLQHATKTPWHSDESEMAWRLHGRAPGDFGATYQILKAVKDHPTMEPYWPQQADAELIVEGINALPYLVEVAHSATLARNAFRQGDSFTARIHMEDLAAAIDRMEEMPRD